MVSFLIQRYLYTPSSYRGEFIECETIKMYYIPGEDLSDELQEILLNNAVIAGDYASELEIFIDDSEYDYEYSLDDVSDRLNDEPRRLDDETYWIIMKD